MPYSRCPSHRIPRVKVVNDFLTLLSPLNQTVRDRDPITMSLSPKIESSNQIVFMINNVFQ